MLWHTPCNCEGVWEDFALYLGLAGGCWSVWQSAEHHHVTPLAWTFVVLGRQLKHTSPYSLSLHLFGPSLFVADSWNTHHHIQYHSTCSDLHCSWLTAETHTIFTITPLVQTFIVRGWQLKHTAPYSVYFQLQLTTIIVSRSWNYSSPAITFEDQEQRKTQTHL